LQNSTDAKIIEGLEQENKKKQDLLNQTINLLGASEIKTLTDLQTLLEGKTLKELKESQQAQLQTRNEEINKLVSQLDQSQEKLQFYTENLKTKEQIISEYQQEIKQKDTKQEKLATAHEQRETELNHNLSLKESKISHLETNLLQLAKQKLVKQKEARALVEQLQKD
jgi:hypothetical protein